MCLPSDALLQQLPSYLGFSYLGRGVSLHGCSSKAQPLLLTLDEGYFYAEYREPERGQDPASPRAVRSERHLGARVRAGTWTEAAGAAFLRGERAATPCTGLRPGQGCCSVVPGHFGEPSSTLLLTTTAPTPSTSPDLKLTEEPPPQPLTPLVCTPVPSALVFTFVDQL